MPTLRKVRLSDIVKQEVRSVVPAMDDAYPLIGVRWYGAGCYVHDTFLGKDLSAPELRKVMPGDIIYNKMWASKGSFAVVPEDIGEVFATNEYPTFRAVHGNIAEYVGYLISRPRFWHMAKNWSVGSTGRVRLNPKDFLFLPLEVLPLPEQEAVVHVLKTIDNAICSSTGFIARLEQAKLSVMRQLLTRGLAGQGGRMVPLPERWVLGRVAEEIAHMPAGWRLVRLTAHAKLESGHTPDRERPEYWDGDVPWISLQDAEGLTGPEIVNTAETIGPEGLKNSSARLLPRGTVVFLRTGSIGLCSIMGRPMATSQHYANWVCGGDLEPRYLLQLFRHMGREWERLKAGSVLPDIYMPVFKKLQVLLPPLEEQRVIADAGEAFDRRIADERAFLVELRATKDALAQELLSGRVRLPASMITRFANAPAAEAAAE